MKDRLEPIQIEKFSNDFQKEGAIINRGQIFTIRIDGLNSFAFKDITNINIHFNESDALGNWQQINVFVDHKNVLSINGKDLVDAYDKLIDWWKFVL